MEILKIDSFADFDRVIEPLDQTTLLRGVAKSEYELVPSLFRHKAMDNIEMRESNMMWLFKSQAISHMRSMPVSDLEWLTIAQHHGLPTRLLDWTLSPVVAAFFAVFQHKTFDGAVYIYDIKDYKRQEEVDLNSLTEVLAFFPLHATKRVTAQSGMFTVHPTSIMRLDNDDITKIVIPKKLKPDILSRLYKYGIHPASLFPGLDGIAEYIKFHHNYV